MNYYEILYAKATALEGWGLGVRIISYITASFVCIAGILLQSGVYGGGYIVLIAIILAALIVVGGSFIALLLEVMGMTARAVIDTAGEIKGKITPTIKKVNVVREIEKAAQISTENVEKKTIKKDGPWVCEFCGAENAYWDNVCGNCGEKKIE